LRFDKEAEGGGDGGVLVVDYQLLLFHLLLNHFLFQLNLLLMMLNEDMNQHDVKNLFDFISL
jgi:hypothetical protein